VADRLRDKVAIVTGAGTSGPGVGTGKAIAVLFATEGATVCVVDRDAAHAERTLEEINEGGGTAFVVVGDVSSSADCERIVQTVVGRSGRVDVLVNNAAVSPKAKGPVHMLDEAEWDTVMAVNLKSVMLMSRYALPHMIATGGGSIVNISSISSLASSGNIPAYGASKAAMNRLTADLAVAYGRNGVRANAIAPGHIYTTFVQQRDLGSRERDERRKVAPLGIEGTAWDVAWTAVFLASDESRFVSAACIPVDGGVTQTDRRRARDFLNEESPTDPRTWTPWLPSKPEEAKQ
jgi:NAD(P)-dependent dehydrogenase (short-subunit alcohol dehydrogenase family)